MLNYRQLYYFWMVARTGGIARACERLNLTPQTVSGQLGLLEQHLGVALFQKAGRQLELTDAGRQALPYAERIFQAGDELETLLRHAPAEQPVLFRVGVADVVPKSMVYRLLAPAMDTVEAIRLTCREDKLERLLADLAIQRLDLVISDSPMPAHLDIKGHSHRLGECGVGFFAIPALAARLAPGFPRSLDGAPLLIPGQHSHVRARLLRWLDEQALQPRLVGEFDDSALMQAFGQSGAGVFVAPAAIADEVCRFNGVVYLGQAEQVRETFYAISVERRSHHPGIVAISEGARRGLFASPDDAN